MDQFDMKWGILGKVGVILQLGGDGQKHFPKNLLKGIFSIPKNRQNISGWGPIFYLFRRLNWSFYPSNTVFIKIYLIKIIKIGWNFVKIKKFATSGIRTTDLTILSQESYLSTKGIP